MSQTLPPRVVASDDAIDGLLARLRDVGANGRPIDLVIPADSSLLLTAAEFRTLRDALDRERLAVTLRTDDPLRTQLARLLGIPVEPAPRALAARPTPAAPPRRQPPEPVPPAPKDAALPSSRPVTAGPAPANRFVGRPTSGSDVAPATPASESKPSDGGEAAGSASAPEPSTDWLAVDPEARWPAPPAEGATVARTRTGLGRRWGRRRPMFVPPEPAAGDGAEEVEAGADVAMAANGEAPAEDEVAPLLVLPAAERRQRRARVLLIVAVALAALVGIVYLLLPGATVAITLKRQPLAGDVVYDITTTGEPLDGGATIAVPAQPATTQVTWEGQIPVTGVRVEPTDRASGPIVFANPSDAAVKIDAGTRLTTETGVAFEVVDAVTAPPRDPATGKAGQATGTVRAVDPGSGGNVGVGEIGGRLPNGVYYSNREQAASGGAEKKIPIVAKADFDTLRAQAAAALPQAAAAAFAKSLSGNEAILPETIAAGPGAETFSAQEGQATDALSLKIVWSVTALAYDRDEAGGKIAEAATRQLAPLAPQGYAVAAGSVKPGAASVLNHTPQGVRLRAPVTADAVAVMTQPQRRALAERLAGADPAAVEAVLRQTPQIASFHVSYRPVWLPDRMPTNVGRIQIEIDS